MVLTVGLLVFPCTTSLSVDWVMPANVDSLFRVIKQWSGKVCCWGDYNMHTRQRHIVFGTDMCQEIV